LGAVSTPTEEELFWQLIGDFLPRKASSSAIDFRGMQDAYNTTVRERVKADDSLVASLRLKTWEQLKDYADAVHKRYLSAQANAQHLVNIVALFRKLKARLHETGPTSPPISKMLDSLLVEQFNVPDPSAVDGDTVMHDASEVGRGRAALQVPPREGHMQCKDRLFRAALRKLKDEANITPAQVRKQFERLKSNEGITDKVVFLTTGAIRARLLRAAKK